jgi:hypothetical protein
MDKEMEPSLQQMMDHLFARQTADIIAKIEAGQADILDHQK